MSGVSSRSPMYYLIANPAAGRARGGHALAAAQRALSVLGAVDSGVTTSAGDEARLVRDAIDRGVTTIAALGGDGTWSKVAAAIVAAESDCRFVPLAAGRGNDFAKSLGLPAADYPAMAALIAAGHDTRVDVGMVESTCFINAAGFGFDAAVVADSDRIRWLAGDALYLYASLRNLFGYAGLLANISPPQENDHALRLHLMLVVANGRHFGGSFVIAPDASLDDGQLDAITVGPANGMARVRLLAAAARGAHLSLPGVTSHRGASFVLRFAASPVYQLDGDLYRAGEQELNIRCIPRALRVATPSSGLPRSR